MVWGKGHIPKQAGFQGWGGLLTRDKLKLWECIQNDEGMQCNANEICSSIYYFGCAYPKAIWNIGVLRRGENQKCCKRLDRGDGFNCDSNYKVRVSCYCFLLVGRREKCKNIYSISVEKSSGERIIHP